MTNQTKPNRIWFGLVKILDPELVMVWLWFCPKIDGLVLVFLQQVNQFSNGVVKYKSNINVINCGFEDGLVWFWLTNSKNIGFDLV